MAPLRRHEERRGAVLQGPLLVCAGLAEEPHDVRAAHLRGDVQGSRAGVRGPVLVGAGLQEVSHGLQVAVLRRVEERGPAAVVREVRVRVAPQGLLDEVLLAARGGLQQGRTMLWVEGKHHQRERERVLERGEDVAILRYVGAVHQLLAEEGHALLVVQVLLQVPDGPGRRQPWGRDDLAGHAQDLQPQRGGSHRAVPGREGGGEEDGRGRGGAARVQRPTHPGAWPEKEKTKKRGRG
mmetsp:Transcript_91090/g.253627  ORF Transcript_91090/g.253627 Transcript_91090/m.253627 type:complete len:238 (+) Transcript_91090:415-1128(+)